MDFALKCNSLKCRTQLTERAVVTTCSHIFCEACSEQLGLLSASNAHKVCPACQTTLTNPDDAVSTQLNPTEDYKTSVLSGLNPTTVVECAGRGLAFWSYQCTQEIVYQEYLARTLTDKYQSLNVQVDKIINEANAEIEGLNQRLSQMQIDQDKLKSDNATLASALREKARKHQQVQELYDRLKRKEMTAATQSAAYDSVDEVLQAAAHDRPGRGHSGASTYHQLHSERDPAPERVPHHRFQQGSNSSGNSGQMMPPPMQRIRQPLQRQIYRPHADPIETPQHRVRLGGGAGLNTAQRQAPGSVRCSQPFASGMQSHTPSLRRPVSNLPTFGAGFGLSAGMRQGTHNTLDEFRGYR